MIRLGSFGFRSFFAGFFGLIKNLVTYFGSATSHVDFHSRSEEREAKTDRARVGAIVAAIENALRAAESEHSGLSLLVDDALARAAVTFGNGSDEYLEREAPDNYHQELFAAEISSGQRRIEELATAVAHFKFLKAAVLSRFPNYTSPAPCAPPGSDLQDQS
jgi:hypothetical protein